PRWLKYTRRYEGLNVYPYRCPAGCLTIGYGHNLENGISQQTAEFMLQEDLQQACRLLRKQFVWWENLDEVRQFVLTDMCFNMGISKLRTFKKFLAAVARNDYLLAAREMLESKWACQVGYRARELAEMMKTGEYL
ncbi:MAG: glycoside hydrolase family protein, partial [Elusimicrobiaceae bacterium]|nr:glycoside hydrolase family protein [Elusimicrobiaceae bacterium]